MGRIFISYRREDAAADANALYQSLSKEFGENDIFKDVDNVPLGANWKAAIRDAVHASSVLLVVMGRGWEPSGAIQIELETAFAADIPVIPLLVEGADIDELCDGADGIAAMLADLNAASLDHSSWNRDMGPVVEAVRNLLESEPAAPPARPEAEPPLVAANTETWGATLTNLQENSFTIALEMNTGRVEIAWKRGLLWNNVRVDETIVARGGGLSSRERHTFPVGDGDTVATMCLEIVGAMHVEEITLSVGDRELLSEEVAPPTE